MVTSSDPTASETPPAKRILVCGLNWLGDAVMSMPALQALRDQHPDADLTLLTKPELAPLWAMHSAPTRILSLSQEGLHMGATAQALRDLKFEVSYILPHSFRAALPPFLAHIPQRIGLPGHFPRDILLTDVHRPAAGKDRTHQVFEYLDLFFPGETRSTYPSPRLTVPAFALEKMRSQLETLPGPWICILPGAARGPSKKWPTERHAKAAAALVAATGGSIIALGTEGEHAACQQVAAAAAPNGMNLAGQTVLEELAAVLSLSTAVLCHDSGGMHLAAAFGTPLVALYGITNPDQTGPLGQKVRILQRSDRRTRDIPRESRAAGQALRAISVPETVQAVLDLLQPT